MSAPMSPCRIKTLPSKLSQPDKRATAVGAANTLWLDDGVLRSTNTDVEGFVNSLDASAPGWDLRTSNAVVLGAGGRDGLSFMVFSSGK